MTKLLPGRGNIYLDLKYTEYRLSAKIKPLRVLAQEHEEHRVEIFYLLQKFGFTTYYRPVHWANKAGTRINIWRCLWNDPLEIMKVLMRDAFGQYRLPKASSFSQ